jgi:hypothetical protein
LTKFLKIQYWATLKKRYGKSSSLHHAGTFSSTLQIFNKFIRGMKASSKVLEKGENFAILHYGDVNSRAGEKYGS